MPARGSAIVVGYDDTDGSKAALDEAIGLARDLGAELVVVFGYAPRTIEREPRTTSMRSRRASRQRPWSGASGPRTRW